MKPGPKPRPRPKCKVDICERPSRAGGMCNAHFARFRRSGDPAGFQIMRDSKPGKCSIEGCSRKYSAKGLCNTHAERLRRNGSIIPLRVHRPHGQGGIVGGYLIFQKTINGRKRCIRRCRLVMEQMIGRKLLRTETVHHRNGDKLDDRPENLELWASVHPKGQRICDLVEFAESILRNYGALREAGDIAINRNSDGSLVA